MTVNESLASWASVSPSVQWVGGLDCMIFFPPRLSVEFLQGSPLFSLQLPSLSQVPREVPCFLNPPHPSLPPPVGDRRCRDRPPGDLCRAEPSPRGETKVGLLPQGSHTGSKAKVGAQAWPCSSCPCHCRASHLFRAGKKPGQA